MAQPDLSSRNQGWAQGRDRKQRPVRGSVAARVQGWAGPRLQGGQCRPRVPSLTVTLSQRGQAIGTQEVVLVTERLPLWEEISALYI